MVVNFLISTDLFMLSMCSKRFFFYIVHWNQGYRRWFNHSKKIIGYVNMYVPSLLLPSVFCFCFFTFLRLFFFFTHPAFHTLKNRFFSSILPRILPFSIYRHLFFCNRLVDYQKINCRLFSIVFFSPPSYF